MVTWVLYLCIGIVIGGMAGFYFAKLDDFSKKQKRALEEKLQRSEQELIDYKDQVTTHFRETATLFNSMTESYQKVHEHLARGSVNLCNNAIEVNKLEVSPNQLLTDSAQKIPATGINAGAEDIAVKTGDEDTHAEPNTVLTEKAESEAPKDVQKENNNNKKEKHVDVAISAARATVDDVTDEDLETGIDTVTVPESAPKSRPTHTVATSPDSVSTKATTEKASSKDATSSNITSRKGDTPTLPDLPPTVTETMAVAEELDESTDTSHVPGSRLVH